MLEKPDIADELIISRLQEEYNLRVAEVTFLSLGADLGTAVYRVVADDGTAYFLKLRKGFDEIVVTVPLFLKLQNIPEIITPFETKSKQGWAGFGEYKMLLYLSIEGKNGFEMELSDHHRRSLGAALKAIHTAQVPPELKRLIPQETFSPRWRESLEIYQTQVENKTFDDLTAAKLATFMKSKRDEIIHLVERAGTLASELQSKPVEFVLCHADIHGGNILIGRGGRPSAPTENLYIVDWDDPILAPKERDLMFIGGGIDEIWKTKREEAVFYEGYGRTDINITGLAYYRYERIVEDLVAFCEQLLLTDEGGADREQAYRWFISNFESSQTIEIADKTYQLLDDWGI